MMIHKMGWLFQEVLYPSLIWSKYADEKVIYLTFDDGPIPDVTEWVLETLSLYNAKATFFCVGDNVRKHPSVFHQVVDAGHQVGNHTFNHIVGWKNSTSDYLDNIEKCQAIMAHHQPQVLSTLFRPPHGRITRKQIRALSESYQIVMWDVLSGDYSAQLPKEQCLKKSIEYTKPGSIIVFHDSIKAEANLRYVLPRYLEYFHKKGFLFKKLD